MHAQFQLLNQIFAEFVIFRKPVKLRTLSVKWRKKPYILYWSDFGCFSIISTILLCTCNLVRILYPKHYVVKSVGDMSGAGGSVSTLRLGQSFLMEQSKAVKTEDDIEKMIKVGMGPLTCIIYSHA